MKKAGFIFLFVFLLFILIVYRPKRYDLQSDLFRSETLPEEELDALLLEKGIDMSVIACIPLWEKQYLIDCKVEAAGFCKKTSFGFTIDGIDKRISSEDFSMCIIAARFTKEWNEVSYPCYRIIIPYAWEKLPVCTWEDTLVFTYDEKSWILDDEDYIQVNYIRKGGEIQNAVSAKILKGATGREIAWGIDIDRNMGGIVRDGYVALTMERKYNRDESEEINGYISVCYIHEAVIQRYADCAGSDILNWIQ